MTWLYFLPLLRLMLTTEGFSWDDLRKILYGGHRYSTKWRRNIAESFNRMNSGRTNVTDDRRICDSKDQNVT